MENSHNGTRVGVIGLNLFWKTRTGVLSSSLDIAASFWWYASDSGDQKMVEKDWLKKRKTSALKTQEEQEQANYEQVD